MRAASLALLVCYGFIALVHFAYYPKWQQSGTEATISYDVSGYYLYLPAAFIYQDLKEVKFLDDIIDTYRPTGDPYQVFTHASGNKVMKYSIGQAVMYSPFFAVAHLWAKLSTAYPADGFSHPYQLMISLGSLVVSFLGLYWLLTLLRLYFQEGVVALTLLLIVFGTNYLNYSAIDGAMTHNNVFTLSALLLLTTHRFYVRATLSRALVIGACIGLMALTRPTEIIIAIVPLLWGLDLRQKNALQKRLAFLVRHSGKLLVAAAITLAIGSLQLFYWKYVSGDWLVYSYQDQGFDWFKAHIHDGLFSYKAGWLVYTPLMVFAVVGFIPLFLRKMALFPALFLHTVLFIYVAFAWSVWWYGGSLGQRTMVQQYTILSFPLAAFLGWVFWARPRVQSKLWQKAGRLVVGIALLLFTWHNLWFTHQAHRGGLFLTEQMTETYFWRTLYTFGIDHDDRLALDTREFFPVTPSRTDTLYTNGFEDRNTAACDLTPVTGNGALCLQNGEQNSPDFIVPTNLPPRTWIRASVNCKIDQARGNRDNSAQMIIAFRRDGKEVKRRLIRMHRVLNHDWRREVHIDSKVPDEGADEVVVFFWNGGSTQPGLVLDDLWIGAIYGP
ncbi:MAG: hypothetical protein AAGF89_14305 [Bacteroidota bacterium]